MILAIDVGNTNIVLGGIMDNQQVFSARLASDRNKTADQYALDIQGILTMHKVRVEAIEGGILSSVVPYLQTVIPNAVKLLTGVDLLVVGPGIKTGLSIRMDNPASVGSDLIVAAVAARAKYKAPIAIVDMGTATTLSVVAKNGNYIGGMIIPGLWTSMNALSAHAAQLPYIDRPGQAPGDQHRGLHALRRPHRHGSHAGRPHRPAGGGAGRKRQPRTHRRRQPPHRPLLPPQLPSGAGYPHRRSSDPVRQEQAERVIIRSA